MICIDPYQELANAIILQSVNDYRALLEIVYNNPDDLSANTQMRKLMNEIHTPFFQSLTKLNIDQLFHDVLVDFLLNRKGGTDV